MDKTLRRMLVPLALTQFIASFAGSNMNVAISSIAKDLGTTVQGVQVAITLFLLTMAALMITGSKLTDIWGRKRCLLIGLVVYGVGAVIAAFAQGLPILVLGYSILEGVGSALMIPPVYILTTALFTDLTARAKAFGAVMGLGGIGAAAGPLIGGLITTTWSWRYSFLLQAVVVGAIVLLARSVADAGIQGAKPSFDLLGSVLSAAGMFLIVIGILQLGTNNAAMLAFILAGIAVLGWFYVHIRSKERAGGDPLLSTAVLKNGTANVGMVTQNLQWLMLMGISYTVSVFLQVIRGYSAIQTGVIFTATTIGVLISSASAGRLSKRFTQRSLIASGFLLSVAGVFLLMAMAQGGAPPVDFVPGLFVIGIGVGTMLTPSVTVVQSAFPDEKQGEISGLSRSVSNLGSSLGTAIAGTILVIAVGQGNKAYAYALVVLALAGLLGFGSSLFIPPNEVERPTGAAAGTGAGRGNQPGLSH
jgi:MFS family permease